MSIAAVGQFLPRKDDVSSYNSKMCRIMMEEAAKLGVKMLFLPEISDFVSADNNLTLHVATTLENSRFMKEIREGAKEKDLWVSVGVHESTNSQSKVYNTHVIIDNEGQIKSAYRKLHVSNGDVESAITLGGDKINDIVQTPIGKLGLGVGYDMRFPELSIALRQRGAELLAFPSAFTLHEGMDHWETLIRARAIDTQTYVFASARKDKLNEDNTYYGHGMIVDPWGTVISRCIKVNDIVDLAIAPISLSYLDDIRTGNPIFDQRRTDVYPKIE